MLFIQAVARARGLYVHPDSQRVRYHSDDSLAILQGAIKPELSGVIIFPGKPRP